MPPITYKQAGVDIHEAGAFIKKISPFIKKTFRPEVFSPIGGFSGLFRPNIKNMQEPILVSSTDGVGTKLLVADMINKHDTVGIDLVAMCVNDVIVTGAEPLFFFGYIWWGRVGEKKPLNFIKRITKGCRDAGCALIGGETAELPGMYTRGKYDLAGFCVGIVDRKKIIDGRSCQAGDNIIGIASSGLHSNGYSLVRKIFSKMEIKNKIGAELIRPTRIYARVVLQLVKKVHIKAMAHITGGGFYENIPRVVPGIFDIHIKKKSWPVPLIFEKIRKRAELDDLEMFRTFNMGIGMVLITGQKNAGKALSLLEQSGQKAWIVGELREGKGRVEIRE